VKRKEAEAAAVKEIYEKNMYEMKQKKKMINMSMRKLF
jgi:hypothetical protein